MKPKIVVVGCGVVGALIAYELSAQLDADIQVVDQQMPGQGSTGAALGVLMGVISHKVKGRTWRLREFSARRYRGLIDELAQQGQAAVPFNSQGIVSLCFDEAKLPKWETLRAKRLTQGWPLEIWSVAELATRCPQVALDEVKAAIYSPADGQVDPAALTRSLITVAASRGVKFRWNAAVTRLQVAGQRCVGVQTTQGVFEADWVVLSAGLGSGPLTAFASEPLALMPVLGQAMEIRLPSVLGEVAFQPVINGDDIQLVPLGEGRYWLGATVEFPEAEVPLVAEAMGLENLQKGAARFCEAIASAEIVRTWSGLRPRPVGQPAPVIKPLGEIENVTLATGHYRNGVLLAPATAQQVCDQLQTAL
ncbi:MAG: FAD-dependent oxidoreductase [Phormidesmis sp.]